MVAGAVLVTFVAGLAFAWLRLRSRSLVAPVLAHVATNGFAKELLQIKGVKPARAQVLITKPIKNLKLKGAYHYKQGYYYFRNINDRILFGGGRDLDPKTETTTKIELNLKQFILLNRIDSNS